MGCGGSSQASEAPKRQESGDDVVRRKSSGSIVTDTQHELIHKRLRKLQELDEATKIPFILVELRGIRDGVGFVEICGKDEYGIYHSIDEWLLSTWGCTRLDAGDLSEETQIPFCDALYSWNGFKCVGSEGLNNMGLATMRIVDFISNELGWTLGVINGGNVGSHGEIREQQIIFKAPHPMNYVAPHLMVELRSAGFIEVCADGAGTALEELEVFFEIEFQAERLHGHEDFCDRYYRTGEGVFKEVGSKGQNNLGLLTTQVCDQIVKIPGWSLVTLNGGNYGETGTHREQQLVFRWDSHPLREAPHLLVELRDAGFIEVCGQDVGGIYTKFAEWASARWGCERASDDKRFYDAKFRWKPASADMMVSTGQVIGFFHQLGWQMQVCSQGTVKVKGCDDSREQQIILRPGASGVNYLEPHLLIELYMGEGDDDLHRDEAKTQLLSNQHVRMCPIGDCQVAVHAFHQFIVDYMGGAPGDGRYNCEVFLGRGETDNNLGQWTMRVCDFMVDRLGWSFVVCNVCNIGPFGRLREQQLVFRYDGERRELPKGRSISMVSPESTQDVVFPAYWNVPEVLDRIILQKAVPCEPSELEALQDLVDTTFKRVLTRDRVMEYQVNTSEEMPFRLEVVHAFRSENALLWWRLQEKRKDFHSNVTFSVKSQKSAPLLNDRLSEHEAYLFHGTNPSSSMSILRTGFTLDAAGKSTGTMFGYGIYLAEASSKSDEYARDDGGAAYPQLMALLVCRCLVGSPYVVLDAGDYIAQARSAGNHCVVGDREAKVGTYREFVFFDESQVMPEYTVIYRRQYDDRKVPPHMQRKATGMIGRFWQVKLDKGWVNVAPEANRALTDAYKRGEAQVEVDIAGTVYRFDLAAREQRNQSTGTRRPIREPRVMR